jgi:hypothetical protein
MYTVRCDKEIITASINFTERLIIAQLAKTFSALYGTRSFIAIFARTATGICPEIMYVVRASEPYSRPVI